MLFERCQLRTSGWHCNVCILIKGPFDTKGRAHRESLAFSGSNQARKGRLVDALAVRGDERRDTLR